MQWYRFSHAAAHDPRLRRLTPEMRWCWVMILTTASESPRRGWLLLPGEVPATADDLAYIADVKPRVMDEAISLLLQYRLLESVDDLLHVVGWEETQFESNSSTERSRKCRQAKAAPSQDASAMTDVQRCGNGPRYRLRTRNRHRHRNQHSSRHR